MVWPCTDRTWKTDFEKTLFSALVGKQYVFCSTRGDTQEESTMVAAAA